MQSNIRKFVVDCFLFGHGTSLSNADSLLDKGIIDSTGVLELVDFLEKTYGIKVENDELLPENLDSIDAIVNYLERKKMATN